MEEEKKIINIETLIINRHREKNCKCKNPHYEIDIQNHLVYCQDCMAVIEPFEALIQLAKKCEKINDSIQEAIRYRNELINYKPYLIEAKRYEKMMRQKDMLPICPKCQESFRWDKLISMENKRFYKEDKQ